MDFERHLFSLVVLLSRSPSFRWAVAAYRRAEAWWCANLFHCTP